MFSCCYWPCRHHCTVERTRRCGCCAVAATGRAGERSDQAGQHVQVFTHPRYRPGNSRSLLRVLLSLSV